MIDDPKQPGSLSDLALERVMRDVFSGVWSPQRREVSDRDDEATVQEMPAAEEVVQGGP